MSETVKNKQTNEENEPKLYHPLASVTQAEDELEINSRKYKIIINYKDALDLDQLRQKYDPYLNQYDYIIGDVASEHLRLKGFYGPQRRARMDQRAQTMADYVTEYVNPGSPYYVLQALTPAVRPKTKNRRNTAQKNKGKKRHQPNTSHRRPHQYRNKNRRQGRKK
ncbi:MAG: YutD family protein [Lactobacillus sp.]|jgi:uncharacterized protein YutD|nr:YutD family protein [Lactobacillus sp.]MCH3905992.1 YutD family protein [Lactobacillus sp.]MCH3990434.1 YutD family protein [Lactobacillus sp.]MCH4068851.1 YutD family protein [Lactobacillus sp.]MCI1304476.1 YutD family protein [Lactobacillus sp.]